MRLTEKNKLSLKACPTWGLTIFMKLDDNSSATAFHAALPDGYGM
jgi:hypothetical protein